MSQNTNSLTDTASSTLLSWWMMRNIPRSLEESSRDTRLLFRKGCKRRPPNQVTIFYISYSLYGWWESRNAWDGSRYLIVSDVVSWIATKSYLVPYYFDSMHIRRKPEWCRSPRPKLPISIRSGKKRCKIRSLVIIVSFSVWYFARSVLVMIIIYRYVNTW